MLVKTIIQSLPGQFIIGGLTVATIAFTANHINNPILAGLIAAIPIGMPSSIFVDNNKVEAYARNLTIMTLVLMVATLTNWLLIRNLKYNKYKSVSISLIMFIIIGSIAAYMLQKES